VDARKGPIFGARRIAGSSTTSWTKALGPGRSLDDSPEFEPIAPPSEFSRNSLLREARKALGDGSASSETHTGSGSFVGSRLRLAPADSRARPSIVCSHQPGTLYTLRESARIELRSWMGSDTWWAPNRAFKPDATAPPGGMVAADWEAETDDAEYNVE